MPASLTTGAPPSAWTRPALPDPPSFDTPALTACSLLAESLFDGGRTLNGIFRFDGECLRAVERGQTVIEELRGRECEEGKRIHDSGSCDARGI